MKLIRCALLLLCFALFMRFDRAWASHGDFFCKKWSEPRLIGTLDKGLLSEASGLAISRAIPERMYHHNDSGSEPEFFVSDGKGNHLQRVAVEGFDAFDMEDMSIGPCLSETCLYLADTGDNFHFRPFLNVAMISEIRNFGKSVRPRGILKIKFSDGAFDVEAIAVHPNGDLFAITKSRRLLRRKIDPARLYRLSKNKIEKAIASSKGFAKDSAPMSLEFVRELDVPDWAPQRDIDAKVVTALDIRPDGRAFALLTYADAFEIHADPSEASFKTLKLTQGQNLTRLRLTRFKQQESLSYDASGRSLVIGTEAKRKQGPDLAEMHCVDPKLSKQTQHR